MMLLLCLCKQTVNIHRRQDIKHIVNIYFCVYKEDINVFKDILKLYAGKAADDFTGSVYNWNTHQ